MNAGIEIETNGGYERYSIQTAIIGGKQYEGRISSFSQIIPGCQRGDYETQSVTVEIADKDGEVRLALHDVYGKSVIIYDEDGTQRAKLKALRPDFSARDKVTIIASDKFQETESQNFINGSYEISIDNFPDAPETSLGKFYNFFSGEFQTWDTVNAPGKNGLRCYLISGPVSGTGGTYVIGKAGTIASGKMPAAPNALIDDSGNTLAIAGWSMAFDSADGLWKITKAGQNNFQYIDINFKLSSAITLKEIFQDVSDEFFVNFPFTTDSDARDLFSFDRYHLDPEPEKNNSFRDAHYFIDSAITGTQILNQLCMGELNYFVRPDGKIQFHSFDYENIDPEVYQDAESFEFIEQSNRVDQTRLVNQLTTEFGKQAGGTFERNETLKFWQSNFESEIWQSQTTQNVLYPLNDNSVPFPGNRKPVMTSIGKRIMRNNRGVFDEWTFKIYNLDEFINKDIFDYVSFKHEAFKDDNTRTLMVLRKRINYVEHSIEIDFRDITHLKSLDIHQIFLFQANPPVSDYRAFEDVSVNDYNYTSDGNGSPKMVLTDKKFTRGAVIWNGTNQSRAFGTNSRNAAWQIFDYTNWAAFMWVKFPVLGTNVDIFYVQKTGDATNSYFLLRKRSADDKIRLFALENNVLQFSLLSSTFTAAANTWYHVGIVKKGDDYGMYIDGVQVGFTNSPYAQNPITLPFHAPMWFAGEPTKTVFSNYELAEIGFWDDASGPFNQTFSPNVGLTDTYTVPNGAVTDFKGVFYDYS